MALKLDGLDKAMLLDADKVNNGVWITLDSPAFDPETGKRLPMLLNDDETKPQRAMVRSYRSKTMKDAEAKRQKDGFVRMRTAKKRERETVLVDSSLMPEAERFACFLVAVDNFSAAGGVQQISPEDAKAMFSMDSLDGIVEQIKEAAYTDDNYLATEDTPRGNGSASDQAAPVKDPALET